MPGLPVLYGLPGLRSVGRGDADLLYAVNTRVKIYVLTNQSPSATLMLSLSDDCRACDIMISVHNALTLSGDSPMPAALATQCSAGTEQCVFTAYCSATSKSHESSVNATLLPL